MPRILLVCSAGGHLLQLHSLSAAIFSQYTHQWVCLRKPDAESILQREPVIWAYGPTNRSLTALMRNCCLAWRTIRGFGPSCIISTGAGVAVPFLWLGRLMGAHTIYIESFARRDRLSLTGWLVYLVVHELIVQHPELAAKGHNVQYYGSIY